MCSQVAAEGRRNKVPLEKGFSQVDWLRVSRSGTDLTGEKVDDLPNILLGSHAVTSLRDSTASKYTNGLVCCCEVTEFAKHR